ncbi:AIPR family protein [Thiohalophilus sp.]|uniref:AIPR family protein n=1 Tax=Thiohalophilus sp. TaxID=3028392 RepID=UPI002ACEAB2F|nr:AIPR family protein [Thiohalophilus sp.]MDZ7803621.1 AIPR family protein [Thiohalophilus sp.]
MAVSLDEFAEEFFQEILNEADAAGQFVETVFFEKFCGYLTEAGELDTADRADFRGPPNSGIRVDGYGGDPITTDGTLGLIIADFNQSSNTGRLTQTEMNQIFSRLERFLQRALDHKWRNSLEETSPAFGLADLIANRWSAVSRVRMFLISNRELSDRVDGREADEIDGRTVTYSVWDIKRLHQFATVGHGREEIEIDLEKDFGGILPLLPAHLSADDYEAYLSVVPGHMLASIYDRWGARLLEQNVRVFLQARGNVNKGIRKTLETKPSMFFAYNNGITATAEEVNIEERNGQLALTGVKNIQIVNGGQTTASIHMAMRNKIDLSKVFVQMKLSIVTPEQTEEVVPKISEYANSQNKVNAADFFANHPFHVRFEDFSRRIYAPSPDGTFRQTKWFYERARGQFNDARSKLTPANRRKFDLESPRSQLFSKTDLAKYLNVWEGKPDKVSMGAQKNFADFANAIGESWNKSENSFNEVFYKESVSKAIIFKRTEKLVSEQRWYEGGYRANIVAYAISKIAHDVGVMKKSVDFMTIWNSQSISSDMEEALEISAKTAHDILIDPPNGIRNVTEWAKKQACWERVKKEDVTWPDGFLNQLISLEEEGSRKRDGRKDQQLLNGIEAQTAVYNAGGAFWQQVKEWGFNQRLLTERDMGVLTTASQIPAKLPTEKQAVLIVEICSRLRAEGLDMDLPK